MKQPIAPEQNTMVVIQESCIDPLGTLIVYAPIDLHSITSVINGMGTATISLLPSGIIISENSGPIQQKSLLQKPGSLVTLVFQIQSSYETVTNQTDLDLVAVVSTLINSTVKKIKVAFGVADHLD